MKGTYSIASNIQLAEISTHRQNTNNKNSMSKVFEYKPKRKDSNNYFRCVGRIDNSGVSADSRYNQELSIEEQFQVEYAPVGLQPFYESQRSGREIIFDAVNEKEVIVQISFDANPSPSHGKIM